MSSWGRVVGLVVLALLSSASALRAAGESYLLIVSGLGGEPQYSDRFYKWAVTMQDAARQRLGVPEDHISYLGERPGRDPERIRAKSTKANIRQAFEEIAAKARPGDQVFILFIGHGSYRSGESRFNLPGPDITPGELSGLLSRFATQQVIFVNAASASGGFVNELSGENRVVVTATKSGLERNEAVFGGYFVQAFAEDGADANKDDRVSIMEAYEYARRQVERYYDEENRLQTEHALIDDNGDGAGTHVSEKGAKAADGAVARSTFVLAPGGGTGLPAAAADEGELTVLYEQARALEDRIEVLKQQKDAMETELYLKELEHLLLELAKKKKEIQELEQKDKEKRRP